jgi:hypothetical protein
MQLKTVPVLLCSQTQQDTTAAFQHDLLRPSDETLLQSFKAHAQRSGDSSASSSDTADDFYLYWSYGRWTIGSEPAKGTHGNRILSIVDESPTPEMVAGHGQWAWHQSRNGTKADGKSSLRIECLSEG